MFCLGYKSFVKIILSFLIAITIASVVTFFKLINFISFLVMCNGTVALFPLYDIKDIHSKRVRLRADENPTQNETTAVFNALVEDITTRVFCTVWLDE